MFFFGHSEVVSDILVGNEIGCTIFLFKLDALARVFPGSHLVRFNFKAVWAVNELFFC